MANRKKKLLQHQASLTHLAGASSAFSDSTPDIAAKGRITLDELSDLYRAAGDDPDPDVDAAIPPGGSGEDKSSAAPMSVPPVLTSPLSSASSSSSSGVGGVRMRIKEAGNGGKKIINRLSCEFLMNS